MKVEMSVDKPLEVEVTLQVTTTLKEWKDIRESLRQMGTAYPLQYAIRDAINKIERIVEGDVPEAKGAHGVCLRCGKIGYVNELSKSCKTISCGVLKDLNERSQFKPEPSTCCDCNSEIVNGECVCQVRSKPLVCGVCNLPIDHPEECILDVDKYDQCARVILNRAATKYVPGHSLEPDKNIAGLTCCICQLPLDRPEPCTVNDYSCPRRK